MVPKMHVTDDCLHHYGLSFIFTFTATTCNHGISMLNVTDRPVMRRKSMEFDGKAKVGALVQRVHAFKKQKVAEEAKEDEWNDYQEAYTRAVSTRQYVIVQRAGSVTGRMKTT
jgi:hypothetical protein